ncbi:hypothetical protein LEP3755_29300 [Leptolyngbya sp. NIES-3755]|nr:hypothetical protein LEP3755_29300 [Leptolyngbya sp. NIES-3755]
MLTQQLSELDLKQFFEFSKLQQDKDSINLSTLAPVQRMLLTTDGTLTHLLEAYLLERIQLVKLSERSHITTEDIPALDLEQGSKVIHRSILLQGQDSRKVFVYAEVILVFDRLPHCFKRELIETQTPLGKLLLKYRIETFKELLEMNQEPAGQRAHFFQIDRQDFLMSRTYRLFYNTRPTMLITEKFPVQCFF